MEEVSATDKRLQIITALKEGAVPEKFSISGFNGELLSHQKTGIAWLAMSPRCLLADSMGTGKTVHGLGLLQWLKDKEQLSSKRRGLVIVPAISVHSSWKADGFEKFLPNVKYVIGRGTKKQREAIYSDDSWEIMLTNYEMIRQDIKELQKLGFDHIVLDEADVIRNPATKTAKAVRKLCVKASRAVAMTGTPIQNRLLDLHGILYCIGLDPEFGNPAQFSREYHDYQLVRVFYGGKTHWQKKMIGYKNTESLKKKLYPYYLRRTLRDVDAKTPELQSQIKWMQLRPEQERLYKEVQSGFMQLNANSPPMEVKAAALRLRQLCTSSVHLDDTTDFSAKFDWLIPQAQGDWADEKIVLFSNWKKSISALETRFMQNGISYVTITGDQNKQEVREEARQKFLNDNSVQFLLGTTAIERSLNVQVAKIQVNLDMLYNPSRHGQLAGRVTRIGSKHDMAYVFSLLTEGTIEEAMLQLLREKQAIADHMFDEESKLFDKLSVQDLIRLIRS